MGQEKFIELSKLIQSKIPGEYEYILLLNDTEKNRLLYSSDMANVDAYYLMHAAIKKLNEEICNEVDKTVDNMKEENKDENKQNKD